MKTAAVRLAAAGLSFGRPPCRGARRVAANGQHLTGCFFFFFSEPCVALLARGSVVVISLQEATLKQCE